MVRNRDPAPTRFGEVPHARGLVFTCRACGRPYAVRRDLALRAWGEQGRVAEAAERLRCRQCGRRGMAVCLAPAKAGLGSAAQHSPVDELIRLIKRIRPGRTVE